MGTLQMSLKERDRLALLSRVKDGQMTLLEAGRRLSLSYRQCKRLWRRYLCCGDAGLVHALRGRLSNNVAAADARRALALSIYGEHYSGFGPTLAAEQMAQRHGLSVDHETLRRWLAAAGLWKPRRQSCRRHRRRERRACFGELVQLDGSDHAWFGEDRPRCVLMVMIDDATGLIMARFFEAETTVAAMTIFRQWSLRHGLPRALYPDQHSIYRRNDKQADDIEHRTGIRPATRFGEAMAELGVELICARSPQAKGRVERANGTLQDRLVKLMKLEGITTIEAANVYLERTFLPQHNARFTVQARDLHNAHGPVPAADEIDAILCPVRERRVVDKTGCVSWQGRCLELLGADAAPRRRREVLVRQRLDGQVELLALDAKRLLQSRELLHRPSPPAVAKASLAERLAEHATPPRPPDDHPWRKSRSRRPAPLRLAALACATLDTANHTRGHFY
jgi:hypothetical protein